MFFGIAREALAYVILGLIAAAALPLVIASARRRRREKLRRRGIKTHGH